ncbi:hypothetical protein FUAX_20490 [Fulvitalea axinellae]|uniref:DUF2147 domain-containing protein n=1 Tax=Fulvitalea axinellae TaxID=1182444 RepID=A0AAU9CRM4_9BACT|nr:hypothetical protein FUAX_20490 [Fulvitalea axinellae]
MILDKIRPVFFAILALAFFHSSSFAAGTDPLIGVWYNQDKDAKIEIYKCGEKFCGKIVWLKNPKDDAGKEKLDTKNPDKDLRSKPIMGINLLKGFTAEGDGEYEGGTIYNPKEGKTYSCELKLKKAGKQLKVRGYIGISLIGKTQYWDRAE